MKRIALALFLAFAGLTAPVKADVQLSFEFFHSSLEPYGDWARAGDYGYVWHPRDVDEDWAPYTDGYWAYTDAGWTWVSYEDWGGITYHYGRWVRVGGLGWCWVPGYEWGPAWVSWRRSDDYVGWAPLPPEARWHRQTGFSIWVDTEFDIGPGYFRFCRVRDFGAPVLRHVLLPCERNVTFIEQTINITNITYRGDRGHVFNGGPDYQWVSPRSGRPVPALKLVQNTTNVFVRGNRGNVFVNAQRGNTLVVAAPEASRDAGTAPPKLASAARSIPAPQIDRGWTGVEQGPARERIAAKFKQDVRGLTPKSAPAAAFNPEAVAAIPKRADLQAKLPVQPSAPVAPTPPDIVASPARPTIAKPVEPPNPVVPPPAIAGPRGKPADTKPGRFGAVPPQPATPPRNPVQIEAPPVVKSQPVAPPVGPRIERPKNDPGTISRGDQTIRPGRSVDQDASRVLQQQRAAEAARQSQSALDAKRNQEAIMERQRPQPVEAPRRIPATPRGVAPETFRRPVEIPRAVERAPSARPVTPSPQELPKGRSKGEDDRKIMPGR